MKVLVHLNHGVDKSYMLDFGSRVTKKEMISVMRLGPMNATQAILGYASLLKTVTKTEVSHDQRVRANSEADFVVGDR